MSSEKFKDIERSPALDDLLIGAEAIGAYAGVTPASIYHARKIGKPPLAQAITKWGKDLLSTKSKIDRALREMAK